MQVTSQSYHVIRTISILVLYSSKEKVMFELTNVVPVLSNIAPLAASTVFSIVNRVFDSSQYSAPCTI